VNALVIDPMLKRVAGTVRDAAVAVGQPRRPFEQDLAATSDENDAGELLPRRELVDSRRRLRHRLLQGELRSRGDAGLRRRIGVELHRGRQDPARRLRLEPQSHRQPEPLRRRPEDHGELVLGATIDAHELRAAEIESHAGERLRALGRRALGERRSRPVRGHDRLDGCRISGGPGQNGDHRSRPLAVDPLGKRRLRHGGNRKEDTAHHGARPGKPPTYNPFSRVPHLPPLSSTADFGTDLPKSGDGQPNRSPQAREYTERASSAASPQWPFGDPQMELSRGVALASARCPL
jgi:hypothetical protein